MCKKMIYLISFVLVVGLAVGVTNAALPFLQDPGADGIVSIEAENYDANVPQGDHTWEFVTSPEDFSGTGAMQALPNSGAIISFLNSFCLTNSPHVDYQVEFVKTGTHYVWVRGYAQGSNDDDSCHVGLDGEATETSDRFNLASAAAWMWTNTTWDVPSAATFEITSPGVHTVNLWMREDGAVIDKIVLTTNPDYTPTYAGSKGPAESWRAAPLQAYNENPLDGSLYDKDFVTLSWDAGFYAAELNGHHVYFGTNFNDVNDGTGGTDKGLTSDSYYTVTGLTPGATYYWRIDEVEADGITIYKGDVWSFMVVSSTAYDPDPANGAIFVDPNTQLSWSAGLNATSHGLYFGNTFNDINGADVGSPEFIGWQSETSWDPCGFGVGLESEKTYYWRIDEAEAEGPVHKGDIWSFTTARPGGGLKGSYYNGTNFGTLVLERIDPQINFNWGSGSPDPSVNIDNFSVIWTGGLQMPFSGSWTFYTTCDEGVRLWVDDQLLIDWWPGGTSIELSGTITLAAGQYPIRMEFYDGTSAAIAELRWEGPGTPKQVVPQGAFLLPFKASIPEPANGATGVTQTPTLRWTAGDSAAQHDVYFGTDEDAVANADTATVGIYRGRQELDATSHVPSEAPLEWGQTCYWRVDEIEADGVTIHIGEVWSFTVETFYYPLEQITATASSFQQGREPENTINGSGLDDDLHSTILTAMWLSSSTGPQPTWIQYEFDKAYKLHEMWVWNYNTLSEKILGYGLKDVAVEYSINGTDWQVLGNFEFAQGPSANGYAHNTTIDFGGRVAKYVKLTANSNWGDKSQYGLSEVRFLYKPVRARQPQPASGQTGVALDAILSWRVGREAASHEVYVSSDMEAVVNGTALIDTVSENSFDLGSLDLELGEAYYWKIDEVNEAEIPPSWEGDLWSFTITEYLSVDDFESYTDEEGSRIYETWIDGWTNNTGSRVGYLQAPFAEQNIVHSGGQSMPFEYNNSIAPYYSESQREWAVPQNWTRIGAQSLTLWFYGYYANSAEPLYVAVQDSVGTIKIAVYDNPAALRQDRWQEWNMDLTEFDGVDLSSVKTIYIGIGSRTALQAGGSGTLYIDDVRLYSLSRRPVDPGTDGLVAYYALENNTQDSSGNGLHGTTFGNPTYIEGPVGYGRALALDGVEEYVDLPIGSIIRQLSDSTFAIWVNFSNTGGAWQRIFDFGTGTDVYMFLSPRIATEGPMRFAITTASNTAESTLDAPTTLASGWHPVAVVIDGTSREMQLYFDGTVVDSGPTQTLPADLGETTQNWLGRSQWADDAYFRGSLDEFRIYNRVLSEVEILYLAGM